MTYRTKYPPAPVEWASEYVRNIRELRIPSHLAMDLATRTTEALLVDHVTRSATIDVELMASRCGVVLEYGAAPSDDAGLPLLSEVLEREIHLRSVIIDGSIFTPPSPSCMDEKIEEFWRQHSRQPNTDEIRGIAKECSPG